MCGVTKSKDFVKVNRQRGRPHHQAWAGARAGGDITFTRQNATYDRLVLELSYLVGWVEVLGSVDPNCYPHPNPNNPNPTLTLLLTPNLP